LAGPLRVRLFRRRPPRWVFWILGAAIAFVGAYIARGLSEQVPVDARLPYWFGGTAIIFLGLYVLSQGTRSRERGVENDSVDAP
jgi:putative Mn2+ efflux pump MntP